MQLLSFHVVKAVNFKYRRLYKHRINKRGEAMNYVTWEVIGIAFVILAGTVLHFVYNWSGNNPIVGVFSPINESTWEHLKLLFFPMLLYSAIEYFTIGYQHSNFISAKAFGAALGMLTIVVLFYTYTGIVGKNFLFADILIFIIGVIVAYAYSFWAIRNDIGNNFAGFLLLAVIFAMFVLFTYSPPKIGLFIDPITKKHDVSWH